MPVTPFAEKFRLYEPVTYTFHIRHGKNLIPRTDSLEDKLARMQPHPGILLAIDEHLAFQKKHDNIILALRHDKAETPAMRSIQNEIVHSFGTFQTIDVGRSTSGKVMHGGAECFYLFAAVKININTRQKKIFPENFSFRNFRGNIEVL
jgi:hypothetical protein